MSLTQLLPTPHSLGELFFLALSSTISVLKTHSPDPPHIRANHDFDIHPVTGFIPSRPLDRLQHPYDVWERALDDANDALVLGEDPSELAQSIRLSGERWRQHIQQVPVLDTRPLEDNIRLLQRAHYVLAFLVHYHVHSTPPSNEPSPIVVPKSLAVPLVAVSKCLGIAPVLTFADTVLWNIEPANPDYPLSLDNMRCLNLFSGTEDERYFYTASAGVELRGAELLRIIEDYHNLPNVNDIATIAKVARGLNRAATIIDELREIMQTVRAGCDPHVFYWAIRPWFCGSDAKGPDSLGWVYEGVENSDQLDLSGPSAGQSTVIHALDVWLDIDFKLRQRRFPAPSDDNKRADKGFMDRMRRYMPGAHQAYLIHLANSPRPLRELARATPALRQPYNAAVSALKKLRDGHIRIACLYVVSMSKTSRDGSGGCPVMAAMERSQGPVRGTGGNQVSRLLKADRDATRRALLD